MEFMEYIIDQHCSRQPNTASQSWVLGRNEQEQNSYQGEAPCQMVWRNDLLHAETRKIRAPFRSCEGVVEIRRFFFGISPGPETPITTYCTKGWLGWSIRRPAKSINVDIACNSK